MHVLYYVQEQVSVVHVVPMEFVQHVCQAGPYHQLPHAKSVQEHLNALPAAHPIFPLVQPV